MEGAELSNSSLKLTWQAGLPVVFFMLVSLAYCEGQLPASAGQLVVSANFERTHRKNIYGKLGVHGRSGVVRRAKELGLLK